MAPTIERPKRKKPSVKRVDVLIAQRPEKPLDWDRLTSKKRREVAKHLDAVVNCGLTNGEGEPEPGQMCVEAAISYAMGYDHSDQPKCVSPTVRDFKISLNDSYLLEKAAFDVKEAPEDYRARILRRIAIAQLGSSKLKNVKLEKAYDKSVKENALPPLWKDLRKRAAKGKFAHISGGDLTQGLLLEFLDYISQPPYNSKTRDRCFEYVHLLGPVGALDSFVVDTAYVAPYEEYAGIGGDEGSPAVGLALIDLAYTQDFPHPLNDEMPIPTGSWVGMSLLLGYPLDLVIRQTVWLYEDALRRCKVSGVEALHSLLGKPKAFPTK